MEFTLSAEKRDTRTKLSEIRQYTSEKKAQIPAVVYGHKIETTPITLDYSEFLKLFRDAGTSHVITLKVGGDTHDVLVQEVQYDPVSGDFVHVDFHAIIATEKIHTKVPIIQTGESPAVRLGMMIDQNLHEVEISCFPKDLVGEIYLDISKLENEGDVLHVSDLEVDRSKIEFTIADDAAVAAAHAPRAHKVEDESPVTTEEGEGEEGATEEGGAESGEEASSES